MGFPHVAGVRDVRRECLNHGGRHPASFPFALLAHLARALVRNGAAVGRVAIVALVFYEMYAAAVRRQDS
eukprot:5538465-Pyramimonas_sp.AAC.1